MHFAEIDNNNIVLRVLVVEQSVIDSGVHGDPANWVQTSYNTKDGKHFETDSDVEGGGDPLRKNFAGPGYTYDPVLDMFSPPQPFPSWILNESTGQYDPPIAPPEIKPADYWWDEDTLSWVWQ